MRRLRANRKVIMASGTEEQKMPIVNIIKKAKIMQQIRERKTINNEVRILKPTSIPTSVVRRVNTRASSRAVNKQNKDREKVINREVTNFFADITRKTKDVVKMQDMAVKDFVWFQVPKQLSSRDNEKSNEITMWYRPCETELHKWATIKKSGLEEKESDVTEGYGLFSERHFKLGDIVSIYLGEYIDNNTENEYCLDHLIYENMKKRISTNGRYPKNKKLYIGAHMVNDINWGRTRRDLDGYNIFLERTLRWKFLRISC